VEVVASLSQGRTAAAQCGLFTHKSVPVIFEPPCNSKEPRTFHLTVSYFPLILLLLISVVNEMSSYNQRTNQLKTHIGGWW